MAQFKVIMKSLGMMIEIQRIVMMRLIKVNPPKFRFMESLGHTAIFEVIWIFAPIQQEAKHDQEKLSPE